MLKLFRCVRICCNYQEGQPFALSDYALSCFSNDASASMPHSFDRPNSGIASSGQKVTGTVAWFSLRKNYGYIRLSERDQDVFVHASDIAMKNPQHPDASLRPGEKVEFCLVPTSNRAPKAINVTGLGGVAVQGILPVWTPAKGRDPPASRRDGRIIARDVQGTVKSFHLTEGWGMITRSDTGADVFVGSRGILAKNPSHAVRSLCVGEPVLFHVIIDARGKQQAVGVAGPNKAPVKGNSTAGGPIAQQILQGEFRKRGGAARASASTEDLYSSDFWKAWCPNK